MNKKIIAFLLTLGAVFSLGVPSAFASFTINGQPISSGPYECSVPCTVEVYDPDGGTYYWDFDGNGPFQADTTGNPVTWTFSTVGLHGVWQSADGTNLQNGTAVDVRYEEDWVPEDIEFTVSGGSLPIRIEVATSRRNLDLGCAIQPCEYTVSDGQKRSDGLYHYSAQITDASKGPLGILFYAWNSDFAYRVEDRVDVQVQGTAGPFGPAKWRIQDRGSRCILKFRQSFKVPGNYKARLRLSATASGNRVQERFRSTGSGSGRTKGKLVLNRKILSNLPADALAKVKLRAGGKIYRVKTARVLDDCA